LEYLYGKEEFRNSGFPESPRIPCSRNYPEFRVPGVDRDTGFQESPVSQGSRSHQEVRVLRASLGTRSSGDSGNSEFLETLETWSPDDLEPGVVRNFGFPESPGTPGNRSSAAVPVTPGIWSSGNPESPGTLGDRSSLSSGYSGKLEFRVTLGTRISGRLREQRVPGYSGNSKSSNRREP